MTIQWTPEAIRALGATTDLPTLGEIFGLSTWRSREMAKTGEWEQAGIRILKMGSRYRVTVPSILDVLGVPGDDETPADGEPRRRRRDGQDNATALAAQATGTPTAPPPARPPRKPPSPLTSCLRETASSGPRPYARQPRPAPRGLSADRARRPRAGDGTGTTSARTAQDRHTPVPPKGESTDEQPRARTAPGHGERPAVRPAGTYPLHAPDRPRRARRRHPVLRRRHPVRRGGDTDERTRVRAERTRLRAGPAGVRAAAGRGRRGGGRPGARTARGPGGRLALRPRSPSVSPTRATGP